MAKHEIHPFDDFEARPINEDAMVQNTAFIEMIKGAKPGPVTRKATWTDDEIKAWLASAQ